MVLLCASGMAEVTLRLPHPAFLALRLFLEGSQTAPAAFSLGWTSQGLAGDVARRGRKVSSGQGCTQPDTDVGPAPRGRKHVFWAVLQVGQYLGLDFRRHLHCKMEGGCSCCLV